MARDPNTFSRTGVDENAGLNRDGGSSHPWDSCTQNRKKDKTSQRKVCVGNKKPLGLFPTGYEAYQLSLGFLRLGLHHARRG